jgi:signal transduction histidine kinase
MAMDQPEPTPARDRLQQVLLGVRARILLWYVVLLASATLASVLMVRQALYARLDHRIDAELVQESQELRQLAGGRDPDKGRPFGGDVRRIFTVYLERNVPSRNEVVITLVDGRLFLRSRQVAPYRLDLDQELVATWGRLRTTVAASVSTPAGEVRYLAVPLVSGSQPRGIFVAAIFRDLEAAETRPAVWAAAGVGLAMLLIGSVLAWRLAEGLLRPVEAVRAAASAISETDLTRRIPVRGHDEISMLAATFNQMLDRLERAFQAQRRFVDDAGHELRTPITIVRGHLELLEDDPDQRRETIALVLDELDRMNRIVNDLLLLAKYEQPGFLDLEVVDVGRLTEDVYAKAGALAGRRWQLEHVGQGRIVADPQRLTQAMVQLAHNAAGHTNHDGRIFIGSIVTGAEARFWVRDTGPGIPYEDQARIFDRFARARGSRSSDGAGLGLAIVRSIAQAHRGRVELRSRPGAGATFTVVVPVDQPLPPGEEGSL